MQILMGSSSSIREKEGVGFENGHLARVALRATKDNWLDPNRKVTKSTNGSDGVTAPYCPLGFETPGKPGGAGIRLVFESPARPEARQSLAWLRFDRVAHDLR